jgi:hypothetical protein
LHFKGRDQLIIELAKTGFGQSVSRTSACTFAIGKSQKVRCSRNGNFPRNRSISPRPTSKPGRHFGELKKTEGKPGLNQPKHLENHEKANSYHSLVHRLRRRLYLFRSSQGA